MSRVKRVRVDLGKVAATALLLFAIIDHSTYLAALGALVAQLGPAMEWER